MGQIQHFPLTEHFKTPISQSNLGQNSSFFLHNTCIYRFYLLGCGYPRVLEPEGEYPRVNGRPEVIIRYPPKINPSGYIRGLVNSEG